MVDNLSRWLRAVRPETDADGGWPATPEAEALLAAVQRTIAATGQANGAARAGTRRRALARGAAGRRFLLPAGALAVAAAVAVALIWTGGTPPRAGRGTTGALAPAPGGVPRLPAIRPAALLLSNYSSCPDLLAGLRSHTAATVGPYGLPMQPSPYLFGLQRNALAPSSAASMGPGTTSPDTSSTNVQEPGVDEPDIVKIDGSRLITLTDGVLRVVDVANHTITGSLDLTMYVGWQDAQLLVDGDRALIVLGGGMPGSVGPRMVMPGYWQTTGAATAMSTYLFVNLAGAPKVTGSLRATGSYLAARLIGSTVRLVVRSGPSINLPVYAGSDAKSLAANRAAVRRAPLSAWLPQYSLTQGAATTDYTVPCQQVSHPAAYTGASLLTIYTLDLTHLGAPPNPVSVAADGDTVYATSNSLYLASNPDWSCCPSPGVPAQQTEIHRFDISGSSPPTYLGSGSVPGRLLSQYSLSDYAGSLRIATTSGGFGSASQSSGVYVLNADTLAVTGQVAGLGKGEQIYAVRFIGALAYVVTFRQTDPLYVLDLHDPAAPKLVGSLQLDGYSDYLHDAGNGRLIGVGQQTSAAGQVAGVQVSLFDVSAPAKPMRTARVVLANTPGETTLDPHAFLYWPPTGLVVVPVQTWTPTQAGKVLVLKVAGATLSRIGVLANPLATGALDDGLGIQRSLIVDGALWTVSGSGVQVSDPSTLTRQSWISFG